MAVVDVVIVSYNSRDRLRSAIEPLAAAEGVRVFVVDNASPDNSLDAIADLPVAKVQLSRNGGFAHGCNRGTEKGEAPYVLFLNPDARIDGEAVLALAGVLEQHSQAAAVAPRIIDGEGKLDYSLRRFPRLRSTFARALFAHRVFPTAAWADEVIRDDSVYDVAGRAEWVSGACVLVRRSMLEQLGGMDEGFFMYCEDTDLCRRLWDEGSEVRFAPNVVVVHEGGASAPRATLLPVLAASRRRYAEKHRSRAAALVERLGIALEAAIRVALASGGRPARRGHLRALGKMLGPVSETT